ncbi:hypothetical protein [Paenibacillus sp. MMO-58]|uniref:hypothetical protein n=1 Tax=Paenibacillus sp. MMO-58 TaxID=3081290 RepID=UPI00301821C0
MSTTYTKGQQLELFGSTYEVQSVYKLTEAFMQEAELWHPYRVTLRKVSGDNGADRMDSAISWEHPEPSYYSTPMIEQALSEAYLTQKTDPAAHEAALVRRLAYSEELALELGLTLQQYNRTRLGIAER